MEEYPAPTLALLDRHLKAYFQFNRDGGLGLKATSLQKHMRRTHCPPDFIEEIGIPLFDLQTAEALNIDLTPNVSDLESTLRTVEKKRRGEYFLFDADKVEKNALGTLTLMQNIADIDWNRIRRFSPNAQPLLQPVSQDIPFNLRLAQLLAPYTTHNDILRIPPQTWEAFEQELFGAVCGISNQLINLTYTMRNATRYHLERG
jgi:hypothetical protein